LASTGGSVLARAEGLVRDQLQLEPLSGHIFLFSNAQRNRLKLLFWDGSGLWVCAN
jgi:transposase